MNFIKGPDFPTGGYVVGRSGIGAAYRTGRGAILMRARASIEQAKKGDKQSIVVTEIPYQVNKARLIEKIADLVGEKTIEGISDLRDESDREGMRIVIELKRGEVPEVILNNLYKHTQLQQSFGVIMLAIVGGRPKVLNLAELVESFIDFRREVVIRRTQFELRKAEARYHILEGLKIALDNLDAVIKLIRGSKTVPEARDGLITQFSLSQLQAQAILDMQLQRLTGLERQKILDEMADLLKTIERLRAILGSERLLMQLIVGELKEVRDKYGDDRRTELIDGDAGEISIEDLIAEEDMAITVSNTGYIKRTPITSYRNQRRGGKGRIGMRTREEDFVSHLFVASTHAYIMIFSDRGRAYWLKVHEIPDVGPGGKGKAIANLVSMAPDEKIAALQTVKEFEEGKFIAMGTLRGIVKKTELSAFSNPRAGGIIAMGVEDGDRLMAAQITDGTGEIFIGTRDGVAIRFPESDVRPMGRAAYGVKGITLREGDEVVAMEVVRPGSTLLTVTEHGYGKRTELDEYRVQSRGGVGIINIQTTERNGRVVGMASVHDEDEFMLITQQGKILRTVARDIRSNRTGNTGSAPDRDRRGRPGCCARPACRKRRRERHGRHRARLMRVYDRLHRNTAAKEEAGMFRPKTSVYLLAPMVLAVAALSACSSPNASEENLVRQFFRASGLRDNQTLANFATVSFDPKTEGTVTDFDVTAVSPERSEAASRHRARQRRVTRSRCGEQGFQRKEEDLSGRELPRPSIAC